MVLNSTSVGRWLAALCFLAANMLGWWAALFLRSFTPAKMSCMHVVVFSLWTLTLHLFLRYTFRWNVRLLYLFLSGVAAASSAEILQFWLPRHIPKFTDACISTSGVLLACGTIALLRRYFKNLIG